MTEKIMKADRAQIKKASRKGLRALRRTSASHPLRGGGRILKYGTSGFVRNFWLSSAAILVMSITLIILFVTIVASAILTNTAEVMRDKIDITIFLKPGTDGETLRFLAETIKQDKNIKSVEVSTSEEEYEKFLAKDIFDSDEMASVMDDEMRDLIVSSEMNATMRIKVYDVDNLDSIRDIVENDPGFATYVDTKKPPTYDEKQAEIATIASWAHIARTGGIVLSVVFLAISILIIFSTIRMAIFSRREEIYMMKLVGADKGFIRGPFLVEAEMCGLIAGLVAATVSYFGFNLMAPNLANYGVDLGEIASMLTPKWLVLVYAVFIVAGMLIGRVSARLAVSKYLRKT